MNIEHFESHARACSTFEELKECVIKIAADRDLYASEEPVDYKEFELLSERVSNIETCLDDDNPKINTKRLRL